jgi:Arc/MetJ-type ribon-helix-helix transcriptional regulator
MRTSKTLSISMPPQQFRQMERLAKKENRTISELVREALRRYQQQRRVEDAGLFVTTSSPLAAALAAVRKDAKAKGTDRLTMREINSEIARYRREQRRKKAVPVPPDDAGRH